MDFELGIVCGSCDLYNPMGAGKCSECGHNLALDAPTKSSVSQMHAIRGHTDPAPALQNTPEPRATPTQATTEAKVEGAVAPAREVPTAHPGSWYPSGEAAPPRSVGRPTAPPLSLSPQPTATHVTPVPPPPGEDPAVGHAQPPSYAHLSQDELMEQARHYLCWSCYAPVPKGHKFCGRCGAEVPVEILNARTTYFGEMQTPGKARLILIRGEGLDGLSFYLKIDQHIVGRKGQIEFPDDAFVSHKHANFFYRGEKLYVRDEGSLNGVYVRIRGSVDISPGDTFLAGEQVFRLEPAPVLNDVPEADGTYYYASPKYTSTFRITQLLTGGAPGMTACARGTSLQLGREGGDLNFPADIYMSSSHCRIEEVHGRFTLTDLNSRNGTYIRIKTERELAHGDYIFVGRKLLRVELNT